MDVLDAQLGLVRAVLEAREPRVHYADVVQVDPEGGCGGQVRGRDEADEVVLWGWGVSEGFLRLYWYKCEFKTHRIQNTKIR